MMYFFQGSRSKNLLSWKVFAIFAGMKRIRPIVFFVAGSILLAGLAGADLLCGDAAADAEVIRLLRLPRAVTAMVAGAALALAGTQMQSVLRNPLADPHIMGVSSGAALGAAAVTMLGGSAAGSFMGAGPFIASGLSLAGGAFAGAGLTAALILFISKRFRSANTLLIFGIMLGFIVNAIVSILQFSSDAESLKIFYSWSAGSFSTSTWPQIGIMAGALIAGYAIAIRRVKGLDILLFGDEFAQMSGADPTKIRAGSMLSCCILTAAVTAFCGPLGFVGITAPHIARGILGTSSHRKVMPASLLTGAVLGIGADLISQIAPSPLPTASTMAIIGIPFILYILLKRS